jgi:ribonuclease P protein component
MSEQDPKPPGTPSAGADLTFPKSVRLRKSGEFDAVYGVRQSAGDGVLVVHGRSNGLPHARLGLTVSRRIGNAVVRNRWKRVLREAFRQLRQRLPALDFVVTPRPGLEPKVAEVTRSLASLAWRVEKRLRTGVPPYPPRTKPGKAGKAKPAPSKPPAPPGPSV